jgi:signal transduction histidine kinase
MPAYQLFSMLVRLVCSVLCADLALLVLLQLRHDTKSRWVAILTALISGIALNGLLLRVSWVLGGRIDELFNLAAVLTGAVPVVTFVFTNEFFETWTARRHSFANVLGVCLIIAAVSGAALRLHHHVVITPEGFITYEMYPFTVILLGTGVLGSLVTLRLLFQQYQCRQPDTSIRVLVGIGVIASGVVTLSIPSLSKYTLEQVMYAIGALIIAGPVFQQRLFNPLIRLNAKLARRAEQFTALLGVGQQTTALLTLEPLLDAIAREIRQGFGYEAVLIYLPNETYQLLDLQYAGISLPLAVRVLTADLQSTAGRAALTRKSVRVEASFPLQTEICIPLLVGGAMANELIGVLAIRSSKRDAFEAEDSEVLQILANQTATAIHNAQLFEQAQQAHQAADAASRHKTSFLAMMNHELRTPLQTILTHSHWMAHHPELYGGLALPSSYQVDLERVNHSAEHLHHLINNVLDLSKIEAGEIDLELAAINPSVVLGEAVKSAKNWLQPNVQLQSQYATDLPTIHADALRLQQILSNLLSNACKFCAQGIIRVDAVAMGSMLRFAVADTGIGIPVDAQQELFSPYKQATRQIVREYGGTGLGLSICQQLVQLHGGNIWFESQLGQGTTFYFTIPVATSAADFFSTSLEDQARTFIFPKIQRPLPPQVLIIACDPRPPERLVAQLRAANYRLLWTHHLEQGLTWATLLEPEWVMTLGLTLEAQLKMPVLRLDMNSDWVEALLKYLKRSDLTLDTAKVAAMKEN